MSNQPDRETAARLLRSRERLGNSPPPATEFRETNDLLRRIKDGTLHANPPSDHDVLRVRWPKDAVLAGVYFERRDAEPCEPGQFVEVKRPAPAESPPAPADLPSRERVRQLVDDNNIDIMRGDVNVVHQLAAAYASGALVTRADLDAAVAQERVAFWEWLEQQFGSDGTADIDAVRLEFDEKYDTAPSPSATPPPEPVAPWYLSGPLFQPHQLPDAERFERMRDEWGRTGGEYHVGVAIIDELQRLSAAVVEQDGRQQRWQGWAQSRLRDTEKCIEALEARVADLARWVMTLDAATEANG